MSNVTGAAMGVLPEGSLPPVTTLPAGINIITISQKFVGADYVHYYVVFPDGYTKKIQAESVESLMEKITRNLRWRYGVEVVNYTAIPTPLEAGAIIEINI